MRHVAAACCTTLALAGTAFPGPLNPDHVANDARWLIHFNVAHFVQSDLGSCMIEHRDELDMEGIDELNEALGIDVFHDVLGLTIYSGALDDNMAVDVGVHDDEVRVGAGAESAQTAVAVLVMTAAADEMIDRIKQHDSYAEVRKDGIVMHSFVEYESEKRHHVHIQENAAADQRIVVAGPIIEHVVRAVHVVRGEADSLHDDEAPLTHAAPRAGSFIYATGADVSGVDDENPASQILDKSEQVTFDFGEDLGKAFAALEVTAKSRDDAMNISQILQGLVALGRMVLQNEPEAAGLMDVLGAIKFDWREQIIVASLKYPADKACELIRAAAADHEHDHDHDDDGENREQGDHDA